MQHCFLFILLGLASLGVVLAQTTNADAFISVFSDSACSTAASKPFYAQNGKCVPVDLGFSTYMHQSTDLGSTVYERRGNNANCLLFALGLHTGCFVIQLARLARFLGPLQLENAQLWVSLGRTFILLDGILKHKLLLQMLMLLQVLLAAYVHYICLFILLITIIYLPIKYIIFY